MLLLSRRQVHAALAGAAAAAAWLAAAEIGSKRPVRIGALFLLSSAALAGMVTQALPSRASAKAYDVERRLNQFLASGGQVGGNFHVNADHYVTGQQHLNNSTYTGNIAMNSNNIDGIGTINNGGQDTVIGRSLVCSGGALYMHGNDIYLQGGTVHP